MKDYSLRNDNIKLVHALAVSIGEHMTELFENGYDQGCVDGQKEKPQAIYEMKVEEYNKGLNEAWDAAKKLCQSEKYGGLQEHCAEIFGREDVFDVFDYTAPEAIAKIKEYEDKQKDQVKETDLERKPPKADCDKCVQKGFCGHPEPIKEVVRENGCYGFIPILID